MSAGDLLRQSEPHAPPVHDGQLLGEKKADVFSQRLTHDEVSVTRNASERPSAEVTNKAAEVESSLDECRRQESNDKSNSSRRKAGRKSDARASVIKLRMMV
jgi:hypothetical protein